ncbi:MAG: heparinase II/III family protein [Tannerella sp.]|nr:heparinase II/III family protein [Tannerella sp.]
MVLIGLGLCKQLAAQDGYYFFDKSDIEHIEANVQTEWGKAIVERLKGTVAERRRHEMRIPLTEGGHLHHYFCPEHNVMFTFNWDKPYAHYCHLCKKEWTGVSRYDWAWINVLHARNLDYLVYSMYLYLATRDTVYAGYIRDMLLDYASRYPGYMEHNNNRTPAGGGKMFGQSLDESVWASDAARAYMIAKPLMTPEEIEIIEKGYLQPCADILTKRQTGGNFQVWHNSGLIALGVALQNDSLIDVALNNPQCGYLHLMKTHVYDDGWWNEGSPVYHYYPLRAMLLSADAVRCRGIDLFDRKLHGMLASPVAGIYADLSLPAHNDGWYGESLKMQAGLYEMACCRFRDPLFSEILAKIYLTEKRDKVEALHNMTDLSSVNPYVSPQSVYFENLGVAVLRSGNRTVVLKYGPHGGGHGHPDKLSIAVHNGGKEIVTDMGTPGYGVPDNAGWYRKTFAHSTVSVDARDQEPATGERIRFETSGKRSLVEAQTVDAYSGVAMSRKITLQGNRMTDIFTCNSSDRHTYDYVLILTQKPVLAGRGEPVELTDAPVYHRLKNAERRMARKSFTCRIDGAEIRFQSASDFEIITAEAPGIPARLFSQTGDTDGTPSYPLVLRVRDKDMAVTATWIFDEK